MRQLDLLNICSSFMRSEVPYRNALFLYLGSRIFFPIVHLWYVSTQVFGHPGPFLFPWYFILAVRIMGMTWHLGTSAITKADDVEGLGLLAQRDLRLDKHCDCILSKASVAAYCIFLSLSTRNSAVLLQAYKSFVRPLVDQIAVVLSLY